MGIYPNCEISNEYLESPLNSLSQQFHEEKPRLAGNNLVFHEIHSIHAGYNNSALITTKGEVLLHGTNEFGQLCLGEEFGKKVPFFPEFRKIDYF
jgi:alpha-tubulin suppressor-like RCC1 family protein